MANNLLPFRSGELVRAYILGEQRKISKVSTLGTIAVERLLDVVVLMLFLWRSLVILALITRLGWLRSA